MGMFDYVIYPETICRYCDRPVLEYQSKAGECQLAQLTPEELLQQASPDTSAVFYGYCNGDWNKKPSPHGNHFISTSEGVFAFPEYDDKGNDLRLDDSEATTKATVASPKITPTKDLDTILENYGAFVAGADLGDLLTKDEAIAAIQAWATQQVVEARKDEADLWRHGEVNGMVKNYPEYDGASVESAKRKP